MKHLVFTQWEIVVPIVVGEFLGKIVTDLFATLSYGEFSEYDSNHTKLRYFYLWSSLERKHCPSQSIGVDKINYQSSHMFCNAVMKMSCQAWPISLQLHFPH